MAINHNPEDTLILFLCHTTERRTEKLAQFIWKIKNKTNKTTHRQQKKALEESFTIRNIVWNKQKFIRQNESQI